MSEWITLDTHYGPVRAWQALPEGKPRGALPDCSRVGIDQKRWAAG